MEKRFELDWKDIYDNKNNCYYGQHNLDRLVDLLNEQNQKIKELEEDYKSCYNDLRIKIGYINELDEIITQLKQFQKQQGD